MTKFQTWLEQFLSENHLTNLECGKLFEVNDSLIGHYRRGTRLPTYQTLQKIRKATKIDMNDIFE